jgi:hypothetical protein
VSGQDQRGDNSPPAAAGDGRAVNAEVAFHSLHAGSRRRRKLERAYVLRTSPETDLIAERVHPEFMKTFLSSFSAIANYMKHPDRPQGDLDHIDTLSDQNEMLLVVLWHYFQQAFGAKSTNMFVTMSMYIFRKKMPELFSDVSGIQSQMLNYFEKVSLRDLTLAMKFAIQDPDEAARVGQWAKHGWTW